MATHGNLFAVTDSGEAQAGGGGASQVYLLPPTQMANDPQSEQDASLSSGGLGYFSSAFGFRGGIVGASFATALPGNPSLPNSTTFGDQILASAGWLQEPGQPNGDHTTHTNPYTDDILFSINVPLDIQERFGKRNMLSLIPKDRHVEEWWVGGIYRHSAWQVDNTFYYVVTHEPKEWFIFSGGVTTIATAQFRFDGTEIGRDLALEELRKSQVLNNLGTTALAAQENGQAAGMVLLTIATTVTPSPDEYLLIAAAGKKGFDVVKAGRASYHIYRDGKRLTGQAERNAAKLIMDEASNDVAPKGADFIVTPQGLAISSRTLSRQGASNLAGNFQGLAGKSMAEIIERVPSPWKMVPQDRGVGIKFLDELGKERIRIHAPSPRAPAGSNSASGWVLRIMDRAGNYYDDGGRIVPYRANEGHIPIFGNPNWP